MSVFKEVKDALEHRVEKLQTIEQKTGSLERMAAEMDPEGADRPMSEQTQRAVTQIDKQVQQLSKEYRKLSQQREKGAPLDHGVVRKYQDKVGDVVQQLNEVGTELSQDDFGERRRQLRELKTGSLQLMSHRPVQVDSSATPGPSYSYDDNIFTMERKPSRLALAKEKVLDSLHTCWDALADLWQDAWHCLVGKTLAYQGPGAEDSERLLNSQDSPNYGRMDH